MAFEFRLPDLGEGITEGQIVRVLCQVGQPVAEDQPLLEVETDKAAVEIPSPRRGVTAKIHVAEGETVKVGQVLVTIEESGAAVPPAAPPPAPSAAPVAPAPTPAAPTPAAATTAAAPSSPPVSAGPAPGRTRAAAAPAMRRLAREMGVDIDSLTGTGPGGRVVRADVEAAVALRGRAPRTGPALAQPSGQTRPGAAPPASATIRLAPPATTREGTPGQDQWGAVRRQKLSQIRKTIAQQMVRSTANIPHVTQCDDADVTDLETLRKSLRAVTENGPKVTLMAFLIRGLASALRAFPELNASFDAEKEEIVYKDYINIGVAVDSPRGLVVPVIRGADSLSVLQIAGQLAVVAEKVRKVQFAVEDLRGGTFTVTNYGALGGTYGTPIINYPEAAILGVGRVRPQVALQGDRVVSRASLPLSLSFDHRLTDGAQAARFLNDVIARLTNPAVLLIQ